METFEFLSSIIIFFPKNRKSPLKGTTVLLLEKAFIIDPIFTKLRMDMYNWFLETFYSWHFF